MRTIPLTACPVCEQTDAHRFAVGTTPLKRCAGCGTVFAPEQADPSEVYVAGYLRGETPFGLDITHPRFQLYLRDVARRRMALLARVRRPPGTLLDVGCGSGEVLAVARECGWGVQGVEPVEDSAATARARGLDVRTATLEESGLPERAYDVVCVFHVVEHMARATAFLRTIARWARPGGLVVVEVPNWRSFHRLRSGEAWPHLRPLEHCVHFAPATLREALVRAGLEPLRLFTPTYLHPDQTLAEALAGLARQSWARWLEPLCPVRPVLGEPQRVPGRLAWALLWSVEAAYRATRTGAVLLAIARVPEG